MARCVLLALRAGSNRLFMSSMYGGGRVVIDNGLSRKHASPVAKQFHHPRPRRVFNVCSWMHKAILILSWDGCCAEGWVQQPTVSRTTPFSQNDTLGVWHKSVNFGGKTDPAFPNWSGKNSLTKKILESSRRFQNEPRGESPTTCRLWGLGLQGYLAHQKSPTPLGPSSDPRYRPAVGS